MKLYPAIFILFLVLSSCVKYSVQGTIPPVFAAVDYFNSRALIWNYFPTSFSQPANVVLGQPDMVSNAANNTPGNPGAISAQGMNQAIGITIAGGRVFLAEQGNNRVLIWNSIPTINQQPADIVLGQPDMVSNSVNNGGVSGSSMNSPHGVSVLGSQLFVADTSNNRILIWNSIPVTNGQPADLVLGQPNLSSNAINNGGLSAKSLNGPARMYYDGAILSVTDYNNNRVLIWTSPPKVNFQSANVVLGQPNMISNAPNNGGIGAATLKTPLAVFSRGSNIFIVDIGNNRALIWNSIPALNGLAANVVLGQPNMLSSAVNTGGLSGSTLNAPQDAFYDGNSLYISDWLNNRILIWNTLPTSNGQSADLVLGQPNLTSNTFNNGGISALSFGGPLGNYTNGNSPGLIRAGGY